MKEMISEILLRLSESLNLPIDATEKLAEIGSDVLIKMSLVDAFEKFGSSLEEAKLEELVTALVTAGSVRVEYEFTSAPLSDPVSASLNDLEPLS